MDERIATRVLVQRVHPAPVGARRACHRKALHNPAALRAIRDRARQEPTSIAVISTDDVSRNVCCGDMLDEVQHPTVRRKRVEREIATELYDLLSLELLVSISRNELLVQNHCRAGADESA